MGISRNSGAVVAGKLACCRRIDRGHSIFHTGGQLSDKPSQSFKPLEREDTGDDLQPHQGIQGLKLDYEEQSFHFLFATDHRRERRNYTPKPGKTRKIFMQPLEKVARDHTPFSKRALPNQRRRSLKQVARVLRAKRAPDLGEILIVPGREVRIVAKPLGRWADISRSVFPPEHPKKHTAKRDRERYDDEHLAHGFSSSKSRALNARRRKFIAGESS